MTDDKIIRDFFDRHVTTQSNSIEEDLKKCFVLGKRKSRKKANKQKTKKSKFITRKEKKSLGFFCLPRKATKYSAVLPMNDLWRDYMKQQLELSKRRAPIVDEKAWSNFATSLYKSDYHGAVISVVDSKCSSLVNKRGICIMETKNTFKIISEDDIIRTIPKEGSFFKIHFDDFDIMVYGKHISKKPAERSVKISKSPFVFEL